MTTSFSFHMTLNERVFKPFKCPNGLITRDILKIITYDKIRIANMTKLVKRDQRTYRCAFKLTRRTFKAILNRPSLF